MTNILIIKQGALGDVLRTTCILTGIKRKYPNSKVAWFTKKEALDLIKTNPYISRILLYSEKSILELKKQKFDIVLNYDEDYEACSLASYFMNKGSSIYGYYVSSENKIVPTNSARYYFDMSLLGEKPKNDILKKKNTKTYPEIIYEIAEIPYKKDPPILKLTERHGQFAKDFLRRYNLKKADFIVGINTGAGSRWPLKSLPIEKTVDIIRKIHDELNAKIILLGGPDQIERNNKIAAEAQVPLINAGCGNYIFELASIISICNTVITSDSLGLHISLALKRNTVAFFGQTAPQEIEIYNQGIKIYKESSCLGCYSSYDGRKPSCIDGVNVKDLLEAVKELSKQSLSIIILAKDIASFEKTIKSISEQKINIPYEILVTSRDKELKKAETKDIKVIINENTSSHLVEETLKAVKNKIIMITTDASILEKNSISNIMDEFKEPSVGCVTGRPFSLNTKNNIMGYWSHLLLDAGAHEIRKELSEKEQFIECTNHLLAFRNNFIKEIPFDVSESHFIPYFFWKNHYKIKYNENAKVFVKNPMTLESWLKQKTVNAKKHENLMKYIINGDTPRVKSFVNEIKKGTITALTYPKTMKEFYWTLLLFFARFTMWLSVFKKKSF